jgi:protein phosphatase
MITDNEADRIARRRSMSPILQDDEFQPLSATVRVEFGAYSDVRPRSAPNEDHYLLLRLGRSQETLATSLSSAEAPSPFHESGYVALVADGIGGTGAGAVASRVAISTLVHLAVHYGHWNVRVDPRTAFEIVERLDWSYGEIDHAVRQRGRTDPLLKSMTTRLTAAYSAGDELFVAHTGPSRAYIFRDGMLLQLSEDPGLIPPPAAPLGPRLVTDSRDRLPEVLSDVIGGEGRPRVVVARHKLRDGDLLMVCTDRLTSALSLDRIADMLAERRRPAEASRCLVEAALEGRSADNVTVVLGQYRIPAPRARRP